MHLSLPNEIEFPKDSYLNLLLFEYQEFLHQPPSLATFITPEIDGPPDGDEMMQDELPIEESSKYAHVFN